MPDPIDREAAKNFAWEAFELGAKFQFFIHSSHCFDGRDLARFFGSDGHPDWSAMAGVIYQTQTSMTTTKDDGIYLGKKALRDAMRVAIDAIRSLPTAGSEDRPAMLYARYDDREPRWWMEDEYDGELTWTSGVYCSLRSHRLIVDREKSESKALELYDHDISGAAAERV